MNTQTKILYIEDNQANQRLVQRILRSEGFDVFIAENGRDGIAMAQAEQPDLILMDINLPGMDGKEITTKLRSLPNFVNTPIIALTANTGDNNRKQALVSGCNGFLTKPIDISLFPDQVREFLSGNKKEALSVEEHNEQLEIYAQSLVERLENKINELETVNNRLRQLDRMKNDFIILVSHELRTPLTIIRGYSHLLTDKLKGAMEAGVEDASVWSNISNSMHTGVERLGEVINEIIIVSRLASGTFDLAIGAVNFGRMINKIIERDINPSLGKRILKIELVDVEILPSIWGDGTQLRTAVLNLLSNAVKFTPDNGSITITGKDQGETVLLTIADTGVGIPLEEQKNIFEQFHILGSIHHHSTSKSAYQGGGLGLGLPIARGIIQEHGGKLWVESKGRDEENPPGSTFFIELPKTQPAG